MHNNVIHKTQLEAGATEQAGATGHGQPVARRLFQNGAEAQNGEGSASSTLERSRRNKTVDKPVKTLGIASDSNTGDASPSTAPAWVALAKVT